MNPIEASELKLGHYIFMNSRPCKVIELTKSKTGKHGHCKVVLQGQDVINGNKYTDSSPGHKVYMQFQLEEETTKL